MEQLKLFNAYAGDCFLSGNPDYPDEIKYVYYNSAITASAVELVVSPPVEVVEVEPPTVKWVSTDSITYRPEVLDNVQ